MVPQYAKRSTAYLLAISNIWFNMLRFQSCFVKLQYYRTEYVNICLFCFILCRKRKYKDNADGVLCLGFSFVADHPKAEYAILRLMG